MEGHLNGTTCDAGGTKGLKMAMRLHVTVKPQSLGNV
jgi:hypothetical protein